MADADEWVVIGKIAGAHGVRGEVKLTLFVDDGEFLTQVKHLYIEGRTRQRLTVKHLRFHQNHALVSFDEITDRTAAEPLRGREVSIPFGWLPALEEDEYYVAQIKGLTVVTEAGERLGTVSEVMFTGANEVYVIQGGPYGEILLPALESVIQTIDVEAGTMTVILPEGLIAD